MRTSTQPSLPLKRAEEEQEEEAAGEGVETEEDTGMAEVCDPPKTQSQPREHLARVSSESRRQTHSISPHVAPHVHEEPREKPPTHSLSPYHA